MDRVKLMADLARDEGRKLVAYRDTNGYWTIGVGHLLGSTPRMSSITDAECDALLNYDIDVAIAAVNRVFPFTNGDTMVNGTRLRALINMAFNRGEEHMRTSTTITPAILKAAETGDWSPVAGAIAFSPWAAQLGKRAERLAYALVNGQEPVT